MKDPECDECGQRIQREAHTCRHVEAQIRSLRHFGTYGLARRLVYLEARLGILEDAQPAPRKPGRPKGAKNKPKPKTAAYKQALPDELTEPREARADPLRRHRFELGPDERPGAGRG